MSKKEIIFNRELWDKEDCSTCCKYNSCPDFLNHKPREKCWAGKERNNKISFINWLINYNNTDNENIGVEVEGFRFKMDDSGHVKTIGENNKIAKIFVFDTEEEKDKWIKESPFKLVSYPNVSRNMWYPQIKEIYELCNSIEVNNRKRKEQMKKVVFEKQTTCPCTFLCKNFKPKNCIKEDEVYVEDIDNDSNWYVTSIHKNGSIDVITRCRNYFQLSSIVASSHRGDMYTPNCATSKCGLLKSIHLSNKDFTFYATQNESVYLDWLSNEIDKIRNRKGS
jgi:hypothetical protein